MSKLLVIDKDGTLVSPKSGAAFVQHPEDQELLPGVKDAVERYASEGWRIVVASNQGGVAAGHKSLEDAIAEFRYLMQLLPQVGSCLFCPDFEGHLCYQVFQDGGMTQYDNRALPEGFYSFRKPEPGMIQLATDPEYGTESDEVLFVGDRDEDKGAAAAAGVKFQWADEWRGATVALDSHSG